MECRTTQSGRSGPALVCIREGALEEIEGLPREGGDLLQRTGEGEAFDGRGGFRREVGPDVAETEVKAVGAVDDAEKIDQATKNDTVVHRRGFRRIAATGGLDRQLRQQRDAVAEVRQFGADLGFVGSAVAGESGEKSVFVEQDDRATMPLRFEEAAGGRGRELDKREVDLLCPEQRSVV